MPALPATSIHNVLALRDKTAFATGLAKPAKAAKSGALPAGAPACNHDASRSAPDSRFLSTRLGVCVGHRPPDRPPGRQFPIVVLHRRRSLSLHYRSKPLPAIA